MSNTRDNLTSLQYWRALPDRVPQRFYVAFCLLMSSVQDAILGQKERETNNLNWSATCSYYSLVHGGRLLCFLALGDYPTQHNKLRDIFSAHQQRSNNRSRADGYPFDWLSDFSTQISGQPQRVAHSRTRSQLPQAASSRGSGPTHNFRQLIADYLNQVQVAESEERLTKYGKMLVAAAPLRNDSNYESLLIAHQYRHDTMSDAFDKLSLQMNSAAESTLPFLIDAFNCFRFHDPDLPKNRDLYEAFLHVYVQERIGVAIRRKLGGSITLETKLEDLLKRIGTRFINMPFHQLEEPVSRALFEGKARLMREFESKIEDLLRVTRS